MKKMLSLMIFLCLIIVPSPSWAIAAESSYIATVRTDSLDVREEASAKSKNIGSLSSGQEVKVLDEAYGWLKIQTNEVTGWVAGHYLTKNTSQVSSKQASSLLNGVRLREGPGTKYVVLGSVNKGDLLTLIESKNGWIKIQTANGVEGWISEEYVGDFDAIQTVDPIGVTTSKGLEGKTIVIDPGHGGNDPGKIGTTHETMEKDLNLATALYLKQELILRGATVVMTRTKDSEKPSLANRAAFAARNKADAFVSVHYNSSEKKTSGILTFYYSESKDQRLSRAIEGKLSQGIGLKSNGIAYGDYQVLRENTTPSVLVELGFLSNAKDEEIVKKSSYQKKAAQAIANGFVDYFKK